MDFKYVMMVKRVIYIKQIQILNYCTKSIPKNKLYSSTVLLPKTTFPLRLENEKLVERDNKIAKIAGFDQLYSWQRRHLCEPEFVLHDGPPYANGQPHMGHAINKILKDTILRYHILKGNKVHYVPGWDCHGLPIELKVLSKSQNLDPVELRSRARSFAEKTIKEQAKVFKYWGVVGDWDNAYATYKPEYVKFQIRLFNKLFKKNLVYRDLKPVYWSPSSRTALAEAELEYNEKHKSPSAFVRIELNSYPNKDLYNEKMYALIWTTTPWTLPANQAICYNPTIKYSLVRSNKDNCLYIMATDLIETLKKTLNCDLKEIEKITGEKLSKSTYIHPIYKDKFLKLIAGSHTTATKGTGLVHIAPDHGPDDFLIALSNKIPLCNLVNDLGCYNDEAGHKLKGKFVLNEGTKTVFELIGNDLVHLESIEHSYPYDWRTKQPVIIRASQQWFLDTNSVKRKVIDILENVNIMPPINSEKYKKSFMTQVQKRPYWCISRQRKWGTPIPVFYNKTTGKILINDDIIRHQCDLIDQIGTDYWWKLPLVDLIPSRLGDEINLHEIEKGQDILDIWFDSGISWAVALEGNKVADMYLEGVDQFTGWFQSSLIISTALRKKSPYRTIYVHGFAVDEKGVKMSKSLGNVVDPMDIIKGNKGQKPYGIDTLRWWVSCHANKDSIAQISKNVLQSSADELQKIRSVLRFTLGCLQDYKPPKVSIKSFPIIDKYMLHLLWEFHQQSEEALKYYQFNKVCISVLNLLTNSVSALYYTSIKDRIYCEIDDSETRRVAQFVLYQIYETITQSIAPLVPHLVEEMFLHLPHNEGQTYFTIKHNKPEESWQNNKIKEAFDIILTIRKDIYKETGTDSVNSIVQIGCSNSILKVFEKIINKEDLQNELEDILQVSQVFIEKLNGGVNYNLKILKSELHPCPRCRRVQSKLNNQLCKRCNEVIETKKKNIITN